MPTRPAVWTCANDLFLIEIMSENPLTSILMPVKNAQPFLTECLKSILAQDTPHWELIAVDDHSTDGSKCVLEHYASLDQRISVLRNRGAGIIDALATAMDHSSGQLITRMDADDLMSPHKIRLMSGELISKGTGHLVIGLVKYFSDDVLGRGYQQYESWLNRLTSSGANYEDIYRECTIPSPCWMTFKEDLLHIGGFSVLQYPEDYDLAFQFKYSGLTLIAITEILHYWRDYTSRTSRTDPHYADNRFTTLKVGHFLHRERVNELPLALWGAGRRGKLIAKELINKGASFHWLTNNTKKIGHNIYGVNIETAQDLFQMPSSQVITAIASKEGHQDRINKMQTLTHHQFYHFV